jgi:hypothetical protein
MAGRVASGALRDVLARFSVLVDDSPLTKLDRRINQAKDNVKKFATRAAVGFGIAAAGAFKLVMAASDATEALNVLTQTFGTNKDEVLAWSKTFGREVGRSQYTLQESVGRFGAFLEPMFKGTDVQFDLMSRRLSELAVDLASFYNTSDEEAQLRLSSGMQGETEAVRRLGVDIGDTALQDFSRKRGDNRNIASMTLQEKTLLRFHKILEDTKTKQGDAKRTANDFANSLRRLQDKVKTLSVELGKRLMPMAKSLLGWLEKTFDSAGRLALRTETLKTALIFLAVYGIKRVTDALIALRTAALLNGMSMWTMLKPMTLAAAKMAGLALAFLAIEDAVAFLSGKESIIGDMLKELTGLSDPLSVVKVAIDDLGVAWVNLYETLRNHPLSVVGPILRLAEALNGGRSYGDDTDQSQKYSYEMAGQRGDELRATAKGQAASGDRAGFMQTWSGTGLSTDELAAKWREYRMDAVRGGENVMPQDFGGPNPLLRDGQSIAAPGTGTGRVQIMAPVNIEVVVPKGEDPRKTGEGIHETLKRHRRQTAAAAAEGG